MVVLGRQEELGGPPQHNIFANYVCNESPAILGCLESLWMSIGAHSKKLYTYREKVENTLI